MPVNLSTNQQEILCSLDVQHHEEAALYQKELALSLADLYITGSPTVASDKWKAQRYYALTSEQFQRSNTLFKTNTVYTGISALDSLRLFTLRSVRLMSVCGLHLFNFLNYALSIAGLSYGLKLAFDLSVIGKSVFFPAGEIEKQLSLMQRLKNSLNKEGRAHRMANDAVWLAVNLTAFLVSGGFSLIAHIALSSVLVMAGFTFDVFNSMTKWFDVTRHQALDKTLETHLSHLEKVIDDKTQRIEKLVNILSIRKQHYRYFVEDKKRHAEMTTLKADVLALEKEHDKYRHIRQALQKKTEAVKRNRLIGIALTVGLLVGMSMLLFPPIGIAAIAGAGVALLAGSIFSGFGAKIWSAVKEFGSVKKKPTEKVIVCARYQMLTDQVIRQKMPATQSRRSQNDAIIQTKPTVVFNKSRKHTHGFYPNYIRPINNKMIMINKTTPTPPLG